MLSRAELVEVASRFGVAEEQVRRDHLISHLLRAIASLDLPVYFFGGTALARTFITEPASGARLSEDIDLHTSQRKHVAEILDEALPRLVRREFPRSTWNPSLSSVKDVEPAQFVTSDYLKVRIQLLRSDGYAAWPYAIHSVDLRYSDLPASVNLEVPTLPSFAGMKTGAWMDRHYSRDLYDLAALAKSGALTSDAADLYYEVQGIPIAPHFFRDAPVDDWHTQLAHQTVDPGTPESARASVTDAYGMVLGWDEERLQGSLLDE